MDLLESKLQLLNSERDDYEQRTNNMSSKMRELESAIEEYENMEMTMSDEDRPETP